MFADQSGAMASLGTVDVSGVWKIQHRKFQEFGLINGSSRMGDRNETYQLDDVPVIWNGHLQESVYGALDQLYDIDGRWFHSRTGRFLSENPAGVTGGQTNLYVLNGNDPYAKLNQTGIDWSKVEGPGPFDGLGAFGYGIGDTLTFGHFEDVTSLVLNTVEQMQAAWIVAVVFAACACGALFRLSLRLPGADVQDARDAN